jgi:UDP-GlcNAc:undecaprenyl-phosphate/decaprenyl-phosphate GlcNAc-1-phosphate transferase|tara:strand:- start:2132 stop:3145 length:1014 start_codon:yes stop_codon:yes gene_type:complete
MIIFLFSITLLTIIYFLIYNNRTKIGLLLSVVDKPDLKRKIHKNHTPKTASFSIALFFFVLLILNLFFNYFDKELSIILIGTILIFIVGYLDDKYKLSALNKIFFISIISIFLCILSENLIISKFYILSLDTFFSLKNFSVLFTILCVLTLVNSLNLADGINGLATGLIFFWLFFITQIYENNLDLITNIILINLILIFFHNYRGDHFLGDSGSLMLSSFLAFLVIYLHNQNIDSPAQQNSSESLFILFIIPVLDMIRLFFERLINKKNPSIGDNNHLHHYLINKLTNKQALIIYFLAVNTPIIISLYTPINKIYIILLTTLIYIFFLFYYKYRLNK